MLAGTTGDILVISGCALKSGTGLGVLRRTLHHVCGQIIVLAFVLLDIGSLGLALVTPPWLVPWVAMNAAALVLGTLSWSDEKRMQRRARQDAEAQRRQDLEQAQRLGRLEQDLSEAEKRCREAEGERDAQREQQAAQLDRLHQVEEELRAAERRRCEEREAQRVQLAEQAERLRELEQQLRQAERDRRQTEQQREAWRERQAQRKQMSARFPMDWWSVLGVAPSTSKDEIVRNYRRRIKQYHPDRLAGLAPEFIELAEEHTKALNQAYANAMRTRQ
jgi:DnaJ-domain-containing protein 1